MVRRAGAGRAVVPTLLAIVLLFASCVPGFAIRRVILMIGDGMGFKHVEATRNYVGSQLAMESLPVRLASSTYEYGGSYSSSQAWSNFNYVKSGFTDSASAATALSTGYKTANGNIAVTYNDVTRLTTMTEIARAMSKSSGVVSTVPFSHATPAAFAAHNVHRDNTQSIAHEMITSLGNGVGAKGNTPTVQVIIGGGHPTYYPGYTYVSSSDYPALKNGTTGQGWNFVERKTGVDGGDALAAAAATSNKLFGLFGNAGGTTGYRMANGSGYNSENPTLAEMTTSALTVLGRDNDGMFLMVEGGAIDWGAHGRNIDQTIGEVIDFDNAVAATIDWINGVDPTWSDTLLVVTADHETGYLTRGSGVFSNVALGNPGAGVLPVSGTHFYFNSTDHTNQLVPVYAKGAGADLLTSYATLFDAGLGTSYLDNTQIFRAIYAATVPEPSSVSAMALALGAMGMCWRRRRR